jgi:hypothetical protein
VVLRFPFFPEVQLEPDPLCSLLWKLIASEREDMSDPLPFCEFCEPESFRFFFARGLSLWVSAMKGEWLLLRPRVPSAEGLLLVMMIDTGLLECHICQFQAR